ncbi:acyl-CoA thioesterase [Flavilitoribacter nigricans]|uniref:Acyl-CoA thioesterase n=1 Tax=Flavilitoribacter nigricans (strain ATCC 23147 / DSM 23189 / NBRC 102662 / NCIMB 1420 / SS-2) TaxID=1122177 RepID=A0A2D0N2W9_FLAN2|nr:acyl-CoA thioesterase [Flavilitoribacter nigricans]PHN02726.1 acyl-CoA thioesterase [Flavilitoribacter nigricans DSM 23189 = NBRC 102662]
MTSNERPSQISLRFLAEPTAVNFGGKVHGGTVMKWIDQAGYSCATAWSGSYCVTVYVGGIRFLRPIPIGHLVEVNAKIIYTGKTSIHVMVDVYSGDPKNIEKEQTTNCIIIFVSVDEDGKSTPVHNWEATTEEEKKLADYAQVLMELRKDIHKEHAKIFGEI